MTGELLRSLDLGSKDAPLMSPFFYPLAQLANDGHYTASDLMHDAAFLTWWGSTLTPSAQGTLCWSPGTGGGTRIATIEAARSLRMYMTTVYLLDVWFSANDGSWKGTISTEGDPS